MSEAPESCHVCANGERLEARTPDGIAVPVGNSLKLYTFVKDHLGSVRSVVDVANVAMREQNDYYTFGQKHPTASAAQLIENRWRYSGKEEQQKVAGVPYIDYGARLYDPAIGRWLATDPLAEKYYGTSPYAYCNNNPLIFVDPDGEWVKPTNKVLTYYNEQRKQ